MAQMQIDQEGLDSGVAGRARKDGQSGGQVVTLTDTEAGGTTLFEILWVSLADTTAVESLEVDEDHDHIWRFTPTENVTGPIRIRLTHTALGVVTTQTRIFGIADDDGNIPPAPGESSNPTATLLNATDPTVIAACERNWPTEAFPAGNPFGWALEPLGGAGGPATRRSIDVDWCLPQALPEVYDTEELPGGLLSVFSMDDTETKLQLDGTTSGPGQSPVTNYAENATLLVVFDPEIKGLFKVVRNNGPLDWQIDMIEAPVPPSGGIIETEYRIRNGALWGGRRFLSNANGLLGNSAYRLLPAPLTPYPQQNAVLGNTDPLEGYLANQIMVGRVNVVFPVIPEEESGFDLYIVGPTVSEECYGERIAIKIAATSLDLTYARIHPASNDHVIESPGSAAPTSETLFGVLPGAYAEWEFSYPFNWRLVNWYSGVGEFA